VTVNELCKSILQRPCVYTKPPLKYVGGHEFCPCITETIRQAYIGGYKAGRSGTEPEVGIESIDVKESL
jgi:hypothetical protein